MMAFLPSMCRTVRSFPYHENIPLFQRILRYYRRVESKNVAFAKGYHLHGIISRLPIKEPVPFPLPPTTLPPPSPPRMERETPTQMVTICKDDNLPFRQQSLHVLHSLSTYTGHSWFGHFLSTFFFVAKRLYKKATKGGFFNFFCQKRASETCTTLAYKIYLDLLGLCLKI